MHWTDYLSHALWHEKAMAFTQFRLSPGQVMAALQQAQAEQDQLRQVLQTTPGGLIRSAR